MVSVPLEQFMDADFDCNDYELYVLRGNSEILYVGISKANIWNRWFGGLGRMYQTAGGQWKAKDPVGATVVENMPHSLNWTIELWTTDDLRNLFSKELERIGFNPERCEVNTFEPWMILKLSPKLNRSHSGDNPELRRLLGWNNA